MRQVPDVVSGVEQDVHVVTGNLSDVTVPEVADSSKDCPRLRSEHNPGSRQPMRQ